MKRIAIFLASISVYITLLDLIYACSIRRGWQFKSGGGAINSVYIVSILFIALKNGMRLNMRAICSAVATISAVIVLWFFYIVRHT
jgi:hypothetical protein